MASAQESEPHRLVTVERDVEPRDDHVVSTVTVRSQADVPVVVRVADDVGAWSDATSLRIHPETEPERWAVEDGRLVAELLVTPRDPVTITYDLQGTTEAATVAPPTVEQAQLVDPDHVGEGVPRFRGGSGIAAQSTQDEAPTPSAEATDADVREAVERVATGTTGGVEIPDTTERLDLTDPE